MKCLTGLGATAFKEASEITRRQNLPEQKKFAIDDVVWVTIFTIYMGRVQMAVGRVQDV